MIELIKNRDLYGLSLSLLLIVMVLYQKMISPTTGIFLLVFIAELLFTKRFKFKFKIPLLLLALLFIVYGLGLIGSDHLDEGLKLMEYKMTLFIFPFVFSFYKEDTNIWLILQSFVFACVVFAFVSFTLVVFDSTYNFFNVSQKFFDVHPSYSSIYLIFAAGILMYGVYSKRYKLNLAVALCGAGLLLSLVILMLSFSAILLILLLGFALLGRFIWIKYGKIYAILFLTISPVFSFITISNIPFLSYDYDSVKEVYQEYIEEPEFFLERNYDAQSGTKLRILVWFCSFEIIKEKPLGVGLGDIDYELFKKYKKYNLTYLLENPLNPHNQYLNVAIDLGIPGLLYFLGLIFYLFYSSLRNKNFILLFILSCFAFSCFFESMLQRQSGVMFFALIVSMAVGMNSNFTANEIKGKLK